MLAFEKIQLEYVKQNIKYAEKHIYASDRWLSLEQENTCYLCNGAMLVTIPKALCFIDCNHQDAGHFGASLLDCIKKNETDAIPLADTRTEFTHENGDKIRVLKDTENDRDVWVKQKHFDYFAKLDCQYKYNPNSHMVYAYFADTMVGIMMQVKNW